MIFDINTYIGHYPFRSTSHKTAADLISLMDEFGIDKAAVSSVSGVFYRDVARGNYELLDEISAYSDRLIPFCNINPAYTYVLEDLRECKKLGFKGVKLFPATHGYKLDSAEAVEVLKLAAELEMPVQLPIYIEDFRQRHPMDFLQPIGLNEIKNAAVLSPETDLIISNYVSQAFAPALSELDRAGEIYYDLGRFDNLTQTSFKTVMNSAGIDHILFGSGAPLQYIGVQLTKLAFMPETDGLSENDIEKIKSENAKRLLKL